MKRCFKRMISLGVTLAFLITLFVPSVSALDFPANDEDILQETTDNIEQELNAQGTSISQELNKLIVTYQTDAEKATSVEQKDQLLQLAQATKNILEKYERYGLLRGSPAVEAKYALAIAAIVSWFNSQGYILSAELLTHADDNTNPNSTYVPSYGYIVDYSSVTTAIRRGPGSNGTGIYSISDNADLHYSINKFNWTKTSSQLVISDTYDYELGDPSYSNITGQAVNAMALAQKEGAIVPYSVVIYTNL